MCVSSRRVYLKKRNTTSSNSVRKKNTKKPEFWNFQDKTKHTFELYKIKQKINKTKKHFPLYKATCVTCYNEYPKTMQFQI